MRRERHPDDELLCREWDSLVEKAFKIGTMVDQGVEISQIGGISFTEKDVRAIVWASSKIRSLDNLRRTCEEVLRRKG